ARAGREDAVARDDTGARRQSPGLCAADPGLLHLRVSTRLHRDASTQLSAAVPHAGRAGSHGAGADRILQPDRLLDLRLARRALSPAASPRLVLFAARGGDRALLP